MNATTSTKAKRNPKALLLDDDSNVLRLLGTALEDRGFAVRAATDGDAGRALLHLVRRAGGERDLGVVVLASGPERGVSDQLLALGADMVVDRRAGHAVVAEAVSAVAPPGLLPLPA